MALKNRGSTLDTCEKYLLGIIFGWIAQIHIRKTFAGIQGHLENTECM